MRYYKRGSFEKQHQPRYQHYFNADGTAGHRYVKIESHIKDLLFHADGTITVNWFNWNNCICGNGPVNGLQIFIKPIKTTILAPYSVLKASPCQKHLEELKTHIKLEDFILVSGDSDWMFKLRNYIPPVRKPKYGPGSKNWGIYDNL